MSPTPYANSRPRRKTVTTNEDSNYLPVPTDIYSGPKEVEPFLTSLNTMPEKPDLRNAHVFPHIISFSNAQGRANWASSVEGTEARKTAQEFVVAPHHGAKTWVGFISAPFGSWVGLKKDELEKYEDQAWHCSAVCVIANPRGGKILIVYDCDPNDNAERKPTKEHPNRKPIVSTVLRNVEQHIHKAFKDKKTKCEVWYSIGRTNEGQDRCLELALTRVQEWAMVRDEPWQGVNDPRVQGCIHIQYC